MAYFTDFVMPWVDRINPFAAEEEAKALQNPNMPLTTGEAAQLGMLMQRANQDASGGPAPIPNSGMFGAVAPGGIVPGFIQLGRPGLADDIPQQPGSDFDPNKPLPVKTQTIPGVPAGQTPFAPIDAVPQTASATPGGQTGAPMPQPVPSMASGPSTMPENWPYADAAPGSVPGAGGVGGGRGGASTAGNDGVLTKIAQSVGLIPQSDSGGGPEFGPTFQQRLMAAGRALNGQAVPDFQGAAQQQTATYRALIARGVDPQLAEAAARDKTVLQSVLTNTFQRQKWKWTQVGADVMGNPTYDFVNEETGERRGATGGQGGAAQAGASGGQNANAGGLTLPDGTPFDNQRVNSLLSSNMTGKPVLENLPSAIAMEVKAIAEGRKALPNSSRGNAGYARLLGMLVNKYDPSADAVTLSSRMAARKSLASGQDAQNLKAFNTAMGHIRQLKGMIPEMGMGRFPAVNKVRDFANRQGLDTDYQEKAGRFDELAAGVATELAKAFRGTGAVSMTEIEDWKRQLDPTLPPQQLNGMLSQAMRMLESRMDVVAGHYNAMGGTTAEPITLLTPEAQRSYYEVLGIKPPDKLEALVGGPMHDPKFLEEKHQFVYDPQRGGYARYNGQGALTSGVEEQLPPNFAPRPGAAPGQHAPAQQMQQQQAPQSQQSGGIVTRDQAGVALPDAPPADARTGPDGQPYIFRNGKWYRWKP